MVIQSKRSFEKEKEKFNWFLNIDLHDRTFPIGESFEIIHDVTNIDKLSNHAYTQSIFNLIYITFTNKIQFIYTEQSDT